MWCLYDATYDTVSQLWWHLLWGCERLLTIEWARGLRSRKNDSSNILRLFFIVHLNPKLHRFQGFFGRRLRSCCLVGAVTGCISHWRWKLTTYWTVEHKHTPKHGSTMRPKAMVLLSVGLNVTGPDLTAAYHFQFHIICFQEWQQCIRLRYLLLSCDIQLETVTLQWIKSRNEEHFCQS